MIGGGDTSRLRRRRRRRFLVGLQNTTGVAWAAGAVIGAWHLLSFILRFITVVKGRLFSDGSMEL